VFRRLRYAGQATIFSVKIPISRPPSGETRLLAPLSLAGAIRKEGNVLPVPLKVSIIIVAHHPPIEFSASGRHVVQS
jgi:hypothetical protein